MSEDLLYLIFMMILMLAFIAYMFIKDKENTARIVKLERAIEDMSKQYHFMRKEFEDIKTNEKVDIEELKDEVAVLLDREVSNKILPVLKSLKGFESVIEDFQNEQAQRIANLEQKARSMNKITPDYNNEEQKIVDLFQQGKSIEQIAKDLRIGTGKVEFALKFKKLIQ
ncbi:hypothetical protein DMB92_06980 [Campylobacter sp. MIT 99-7217]|uniref:DUF6115 domain-containing protein n=1 Tax=Campylobacter sp. MIT 99-7217 TaxID=535091 RepID=UPI00115B79A7|nr:hypothetical protein [Campylobacter sp. MIT 99-7217]TQR30959.1 hypothetical protein DMB92_06980 [Campylobacter sp. MIT 99-7217]